MIVSGLSENKQIGQSVANFSVVSVECVIHKAGKIAEIACI